MCVLCRLKREKNSSQSNLTVFVFSAIQDYQSRPWHVTFCAHSVNFIKLCVLFCLAAAKASADCAHTEANTLVPRGPAFAAPPCWRITFQDWLGYTFGPVRSWHTYRKKACPVSSLSPWLILMEVLNIATPFPSTQSCCPHWPSGLLSSRRPF